MEVNNEKFVDFHTYCQQCVYKNVNDTEGESPCNECLAEPVNVYSHKPVKFKKKEQTHAERRS